MIAEHRYTVFASDLVRSRQFYENRLGCTLSDIDENGFTATRDGLRVDVEGGAVRRKFGKKWLAEAGVYSLHVAGLDQLYNLAVTPVTDTTYGVAWHVVPVPE